MDGIVSGFMVCWYWFDYQDPWLVSIGLIIRIRGWLELYQDSWLAGNGLIIRIHGWLLLVRYMSGYRWKGGGVRRTKTGVGKVGGGGGRQGLVCRHVTWSRDLTAKKCTCTVCAAVDSFFTHPLLVPSIKKQF